MKQASKGRGEGICNAKGIQWNQNIRSKKQNRANNPMAMSAMVIVITLCTTCPRNPRKLSIKIP
jgi:hypothetical protein